MTAIWIDSELTEAVGRNFARELERGDGTRNEIVVDSPGGEVGAAWAMATAVRHAARSTLITIARADSAALLLCIFCRARPPTSKLPQPTRIVACADATAFVHPLMIGGALADFEASTASDLVDAADALRRGVSHLSAALGKLTGQSVGYWRYIMSQERTLSAQQLLNYGVCDATTPRSVSEIRSQRWG